MEQYEVCDNLQITLNLNRFRNLSDNHRKILMQALIRVLSRHSEYLPVMKYSTHLGIIERTPPILRRTPHEFHESLRDKMKRNNMVSKQLPINIDLGCFPTSDFIFSQNPVYIPDFYKSKVEISTGENQLGLPTTQYPVNLLLGNVNIIKYFNAIRYLAQPLSLSTLTPQVPVQSYITYLWGAAIDQYYQVAMQNSTI